MRNEIFFLEKLQVNISIKPGLINYYFTFFSVMANLITSLASVKSFDLDLDDTRKTIFWLLLRFPDLFWTNFGFCLIVTYFGMFVGYFSCYLDLVRKIYLYFFAVFGPVLDNLLAVFAFSWPFWTIYWPVFAFCGPDLFCDNLSANFWNRKCWNPEKNQPRLLLTVFCTLSIV